MGYFTLFFLVVLQQTVAQSSLYVYVSTDDRRMVYMFPFVVIYICRFLRYNKYFDFRMLWTECNLSLKSLEPSSLTHSVLLVSHQYKVHFSSAFSTDLTVFDEGH